MDGQQEEDPNDPLCSRGFPSFPEVKIASCLLTHGEPETSDYFQTDAEIEQAYVKIPEIGENGEGILEDGTPPADDKMTIQQLLPVPEVGMLSPNSRTTLST